MKSSKQKILLFGPIGDFGGRELESGFIASVLSDEYEVAICTTGTITRKSQVFDFNKKQKIFGVKALLMHHFFILKLLAFLSFFKNGCKGNINDCVNNTFAKRFLDYDKKVQIVLENLIIDYEAIFVVAQLSSGLVSDVIKIAKSKNKKVFFRTTGTITFSDYDFINFVDCFIHHSQNNAEQIENSTQYKYTIIDQCAYNEKALLDIPFVNNRVNCFLTLARLEKEKNIDIVIKAFLKVKKDDDVLFVVGDGTEIQNLKDSAKNEKNIIFTGFIKNNELQKYFSLVDCVIIPYYEFETGPLTGIEAMAASRLIISATTGAMQGRLPFNSYWFVNSIDELSRQILLIKDLNTDDVLTLSKKMRGRYLEEYSIKNIGAKYLDVVNEAFNSCE